MGMLWTWLVVVCLSAQVSMSYHIEFEKNDMELDNVEEALIPVPDNIAGAPGSSQPELYNSGVAHTTHSEAAVMDPCGMDVDAPSLSSSPSMTPSRPPSPSPSPSDFVTYEVAVNTRALTILGIIARKLCVAVDHRIVQSLSRSLAATNTSIPPEIVCNNNTNTLTYPVPSPLPSSPAQNQGPSSQAVQDYVDNALAGYVDQPILPDSRETTGTMDANVMIPVMMLMDVFHSNRPVDIDAFKKVVLLFENRIPATLQCGYKVPPMSDMLNAVVYNITQPCTQVFGTGISDLLPESLLLDITSMYLLTLFNRMLDVFGLSGLVPPPSPSPSPVLDPEAMSPPIAHVYGFGGGDCGDSELANEPIVEDLQEFPGRRDETLLEPAKADLPPFGTDVGIQWGPRNFNFVLFNEPPP